MAQETFTGSGSGGFGASANRASPPSDDGGGASSHAMSLTELSTSIATPGRDASGAPVTPMRKGGTLPPVRAALPPVRAARPSEEDSAKARAEFELGPLHNPLAHPRPRGSGSRSGSRPTPKGRAATKAAATAAGSSDTIVEPFRPQPAAPKPKQAHPSLRLSASHGDSKEGASRPDAAPAEPGESKDALPEPDESKRRRIRRLMTEVAEAAANNDAGPKDAVKPPYCINPDSRWKNLWDWTLLILVMYSSIFIPLNVAFGAIGALSDFDRFVDIVFVVDIVLNFFTGVENEWGQMTYELRVIAFKYAKTFLGIDVLAVIPFENLATLVGVSSTDFSTLSLMKVPRLLRIGRLMKKFNQFAAANAFRIVNLLVGFLLLAHWMACAWFKVGLIVNEDEEAVLDDWLTDEFGDGFNSTTASQRYVVSMYWALTTLTTVGYGDISPLNDKERMVAMAMFIIGAVVSASLFANVTSLISKFDEASTLYKDKVQAVNEFFSLHDTLPDELLQKTLKYVEAQWAIEKGIDINSILDELPVFLRGEIKMKLHGDSIAKMPFFKACGDSFLRALVLKLEPQVALEGDSLVKVGDLASHMYFVHEGHVAVINPEDDQVVLALGPGSFFGEAALLKQSAASQRRTATIRAQTFCYLYALSAQDFDEVLRHFPEVRRHIEDMSEKREEVARVRTRVRKLARQATRKHLTQLKSTGKVLAAHAAASHRIASGAAATAGGRLSALRDDAAEAKGPERAGSVKTLIKKGGDREELAALVLQTMHRWRLFVKKCRSGDPPREPTFMEETTYRLDLSGQLWCFREANNKWLSQVAGTEPGSNAWADKSRSSVSGASSDEFSMLQKKQQEKLQELEAHQKALEASIDALLSRLSKLT